ncbi:MAG: metallopeptidase family protein [Roseiflexus sp.]|jgi:predicted Zn-dependent protease with MMP-like domain|uniref:metallopeptidase family protein n=1 Tax=Roseiflexus sp. TaxID=2562120 RepID=UPI001B02988F|nr:metallopeptidase family protein [Roseiflexus sp.]MBO9323920.1 metallopeptidase family protein [Roseiflexus sp.]MBO9326084.1 metallopeptidase family protein [Roseiflexus sp.]MBO9342768.1 metallopeptidase family protein [Roseiflexus sp.]MCL6540926.1 metallopeptidase family protein [Roseiflexus sp.]
MDRKTFESIVIEALDSLPPEFARYLTNVEVRIEARPSREQRRALGLRPWQTIYGLYEGVPLTERTDGDPLIPDVITIFQAPLVRDFPSRDALREEVRRTVLHEIAHFFGISDERLHELDAY